MNLELKKEIDSQIDKLALIEPIQKYIDAKKNLFNFVNDIDEDFDIKTAYIREIFHQSYTTHINGILITDNNINNDLFE